MSARLAAARVSRRGTLAALASLAGCSLGPDYARPSFDLPPAFRASQASAEAAWPAPDWWRGLGLPELDRLMEQARARSPDLAAAAARVVQADAQVRISGAPLLPAVNGGGGASWQRAGTGSGRSSGLYGAQGHYVEQRSYDLSLSASYEIDFWGKNRAALQAAQAGAIASRFDQATVALGVEASVATTYLAVLGAQDRLQVARRNLADAERILAAYRGRVAAGTASALDVSQQEALVANQRAAIPGIESTLAQNRAALGILVGEAPERLTIEGGSLEQAAVPAVAPGLPSDLLLRRPDIAYAEAELVAANANIRAARAAFFPSIGLTASGGLTSAALSALTGPGTLVAQLAASLTQPIFDNGLRRGELEAAKGRYAELVADYVKAVLQGLTDVEQALDASRYAAEQETLYREAVRVAQRSSDIARAQLAAGTIDIITLLNTQQTLFSDLDLLIQTRLARFQALVSLFKALGGGWWLEGGTSAAGGGRMP